VRRLQAARGRNKTRRAWRCGAAGGVGVGRLAPGRRPQGLLAAWKLCAGCCSGGRCTAEVGDMVEAWRWPPWPGVLFCQIEIWQALFLAQAWWLLRGQSRRLTCWRRSWASGACRSCWLVVMPCWAPRPAGCRDAGTAVPGSSLAWRGAPRSEVWQRSLQREVLLRSRALRLGGQQW
jgi:hypothetical protein